ncbi:MAG: HAMP domain-containing histidine kinase [Desulfobacterales bacterium]|nr:HAMP domain-containing histidine kinase [Desulfobacterales bacterium]
MKQTRWLFHPITVFIFSILALGLSLALYIYWYISVSSGLQALAERLNIAPDQVLEPRVWLVILVLSILVGIILMGIFTIFVYNQKTLQLFRLQHNFINNFTHELKTPVTSLKLFLETVSKHDLPREDQLKYIAYMLADVERLSDHINRILNLARLESKSYQGIFEEIDIAAAVTEIVDANRPVFANSDIRINNPLKAPCTYRVDRLLFETLVMNLLTNAIRHNNAGVPQIDIHFHQDKRNLSIQFKDNGIGVNAKETKKVFRKFYQARRSGSALARGSGLGLNLAQSIARLHKWRISAEGRTDTTGSVFTLILPEKTKVPETT